VSPSIAAASIVAKVTRDRSMVRLHRRFPEYGFKSNKGYGTAEHREALKRLGPSPVHRMSFWGIASGYYASFRVDDDGPAPLEEEW
jgi:ribonuclease HII